MFPIIPILLYIIILILFFLFKPTLFFDKKGNMYRYNNKSMLTLDIIYPIIALLCYYLYLILIIIFNIK